MEASPLDKLRHTRNDLAAKVFALREDPEGMPLLPPSLLTSRLPVDPELDRHLKRCFSTSAKGKEEELKMEIDILRRLQRGRETEQLIRAYGVVNMVTPVKWRGKTVWGIVSGPMKVTPWSQAERNTLASLCGCTVSRLPIELENCPVVTQDHLRAVTDRQNHMAEVMALLIEAASQTSDEPASSSAPGGDPAVMDLLQPGFADHLDVLFHTVQKEVQSEQPLSDASRKRLQGVAQRGRHLATEIRRLGSEQLSKREWVSIHELLQHWSSHLQEKIPSLRVTLKCQGDADKVFGNPHAWHHLLFTLLNGVADGLPEATGMLGISTRDDQREGRDCLHLEIRDSGGLATFAGVGRPLDEEIFTEQNEAMADMADWLALAEDLDADLRILREKNGVVSRIELWAYTDEPAEGMDLSLPPERHPIWIVEDNDQDFDHLVHMLEGVPVSPVRLRCGLKLREHYLGAKTPPALIVLKYLLPDERGAGLRTWLYEQDPDLPVLLISGFSGTHPGISTVSNLPSTLYLQKPFDRQALVDLLHMTLDNPSVS